MVWVRRRTLWGREERKKGNTTEPFFSGDKVLLDRKALDAPEGRWGLGGGLWLSGGIALALPQDEAALHAPQQQRPGGCRKLLLGKGPEQIWFKLDHITAQHTAPRKTFAVRLCTDGEVYAPQPGTQCPSRALILCPRGLQPPLTAEALSANHHIPGHLATTHTQFLRLDPRRIEKLAPVLKKLTVRVRKPRF